MATGSLSTIADAINLEDRMKRVMVRYKVKKDSGEENERYIQKVFEELKQNSPQGLRYASFKLDDGVSFVHIASVETNDGSNPLAATQAFKKFQETLKGRVEEPPVAVELHEVGSYDFFSG